jgi:integrase
MAARSRDPIKRVELSDGRTRYRFVVDVGEKPRIDRKSGKPALDENGRPVMMRDQRTFTYDSLKEARAERARVISETAKGTYVKPTKVTVEKLIALWLESKQLEVDSKALKPTTLRHYIDVLKPVRDRYGSKAAQQLTRENLEALVRDMLSGAARRRGAPGTPLSPRAINATLTAITMVLEAAVIDGKLTRNVAKAVKRVGADPDTGADRGEWEAEDAVKFLRSVKDDRLYPLFLCSMLGLRRGEVCGLRWDHVDLTGLKARERGLPKGTPSIAVVNNRVVTLNTTGQRVVLEGSPKGKGRRRAPYLPIPSLLVVALEALKLKEMEEAEAAGEAYQSCPTCSGAHVLVDELGRPYRPEWYSDRFVALGEKIGMTRVPLHGSRHCAASLLADLGVPEVAIAAWLGHTKVEVTRGYTHVFAERLAETSKALGEALAG